MIDDKEMEKALHFLRTHQDEYAQAKADLEYLKEFKKSKKAMLINEAEQTGRKTQQERESYAYSHQEYIDILDGIRAATFKSEKLRLNLEGIRINFERYKMKHMMVMAEMKLR